MNPQTVRLFGLMGIIDLVTAVVLGAVGVSQDIMGLQIAGFVLLLSGVGMLAFVIVQRNKPTSL